MKNCEKQNKTKIKTCKRKKSNELFLCTYYNFKTKKIQATKVIFQIDNFFKYHITEKNHIGLSQNLVLNEKIQNT